MRDNGAKLAKLLDEVVTFQEDVSTQRFHARDLRNALRHKREEEDDMRLALRNKLNLISPQAVHTEAATINKAVEDLQAVTASYLVLESEYHKVEDGLGQQEYNLDKCVTRLTGILRKQVTSLNQQHHDIYSDSGSLAHYASTGNPNRVSPEMAEYLSLVGDARMLRERLGELEMEYMDLIDQQQVREYMGLALDHNAQLFLDQYEDERGDIEEKLSAVLTRLDNHSEHKRPCGDAITDEQWRNMLKEYLPTPPEDQPPPDPLRASGLDDRAPFFETARPLPLNKSNFVNHWLLYRLRHSAVEILQFKSQPELLNLVEDGWDRDSISQMAMRLWYQDGTTKER